MAFPSGFCERDEHFLEILFAGGSSSTSLDLFLIVDVNTISGVSGGGSVVATKVESRTGADTKSSTSSAGVEATKVEFRTGGRNTGDREVSVVEMSGLW